MGEGEAAGYRFKGQWVEWSESNKKRWKGRLERRVVVYEGVLRKGIQENGESMEI
jgi:hypothetical protein